MKFWQVDVFVGPGCLGNPAAVFLLEKPLDKERMRELTQALGVSEAAFVLLGEPFKIRWFSAKQEMQLCGHATLAAAHVLKEQKLVQDHVVLESASGPLTVEYRQDEYTLALSPNSTCPQPDIKHKLTGILGIEPVYVGSNGEDCVVVMSDSGYVHSFIRDQYEISFLQERRFLITAEDQEGASDYVYRCFYTKHPAEEDPVTGSANRALGPYWAKCLHKDCLVAHQTSIRGGSLGVKVTQDKVFVSGLVRTDCEGKIDKS